MLAESIDKERLVYNPLGDEHSKLEVISFTHLLDGSKYTIDQMPLLAARISTLREGKTGESAENDQYLLSETLAQKKHHTPFEHTSITFRVVAPIMVFREWHRHRVPFSYNEASGRYMRAKDVNSKIFRFYFPRILRLQSSKNKQGSSDNVLDLEKYIKYKEWHDTVTNEIKKFYLAMANDGVATELCRLDMPVSTYSEMYASANIRGWYNFYELRAAESAQWEIRQYALAIGKILEYLFPDTWRALSKWKNCGLSDEEIDALMEDLGNKISNDNIIQGGADAVRENLYHKLEELRRRP